MGEGREDARTLATRPSGNNEAVFTPFSVELRKTLGKKFPTNTKDGGRTAAAAEARSPTPPTLFTLSYLLFLSSPSTLPSTSHE